MPGKRGCRSARADRPHGGPSSPPCRPGLRCGGHRRPPALEGPPPGFPARNRRSGGIRRVRRVGDPFTAGIAARLKGPVLWCLTRRDLFAPGLMNAGLHPDRVIYVEASRDRDILPLIEEGLREGTRSRGRRGDAARVDRLATAAACRRGVRRPGAILRRWWTVAEKDLTALPTAASTRWRIAPTSSETMPAPGLGRPRWQVDLRPVPRRRGSIMDHRGV